MASDDRISSRVRVLARVLACAVVVGSAALAAAAASPAASPNVLVTTDIPSSTVLDTTGCPPDQAGITAFGVVQPGTTVLTPSDCTVSFGSTSDTASLRLAQADGRGGAMAEPTDRWARVGTGNSATFFAIDSFGGTTWALQSSSFPQRKIGAGSWQTSSQLTCPPNPGPCIGGNNNHVSVPSATAAWIAGDNTDHVWRTTNGTAPTPTWSVTSTAPGFNVRGVAATSDLNAWVVGENGTVKRTTDGGANWTDVSPPSVSWSIRKIRLLDANSLLVWGTGAGQMRASDDSGATWRTLSTPMQTVDAIPLATGAVINDVIAVTNEALVFTTANATAGAGTTWVQRVSNVPRDQNFVAIECTSSSACVAIGTNGVTTRTTNGGLTWTPGTASTNHRLIDVVDTGGGNLLAVTTSRNIISSPDAGVTWSQTYSDFSRNSYYGVAASTEGRAWRVGSDGIIQRSSDGGATWPDTQRGGHLTSNADLWAAHAFDSNRVVAVGRGGTILRTVDGGDTWRSVASGTGQELVDVAGNDRGFTVAVGARGTVVWSSDFGATWRIVQSGTSEKLLRVGFFKDDKVMALGPAPVGIRSTDGGRTWSSTSLPSGTNRLLSLGTDPNSNSAIYQGGTSYWRSDDAGATWSLVSTGQQYMSSIIMLSSTRVVGISDGIPPVLSIDGGATFTNMYPGAPTISAGPLYDVAAFDQQALVTVGAGEVTGITTASNPVADFQAGVNGWQSGTQAFGACLRSTTATAVWSTNATCDQSTDGAHWHNIPASADSTSELARTALGAGTRTANLRFGLRLPPNQPNGTLAAVLSFSVVAPAA